MARDLGAKAGARALDHEGPVGLWLEPFLGAPQAAKIGEGIRFLLKGGGSALLSAGHGGRQNQGANRQSSETHACLLEIGF
jgi:hypothetical protein